MKAIAYYRTSSVAGLGDDKDSETRQRMAVTKYAKKNGLVIENEYYDTAVKGTDNVWDRPAFGRMLSERKADIVLVETANRFARDLIVQLTGHKLLKDHGFTLIPVDAPDHFMDETPTAIMVRQILGAVSEFEKSALVDRMIKGKRKRLAATGWCGGNPPVAPEVKAAALSFRAQGLSYRAVAWRLESMGHRAYGPQSVKRMVAGDVMVG